MRAGYQASTLIAFSPKANLASQRTHVAQVGSGSCVDGRGDDCGRVQSCVWPVGAAILHDCWPGCGSRFVINDHSSALAPASIDECKCTPLVTGVGLRSWTLSSWSAPSGRAGGVPAARKDSTMSARMAPALAKSIAVMAGSIQSSSSRRRRSSVLMAQISLSASRTLR